MPLSASERVPAAPFREAVEFAVDQGDNYSAIARRAGWVHSGNGGGDVSYLKRLIGLQPWSSSIHKGKRYPSHTTDYLSYSAAVKLAEALGLDPYECGI